MAIQPIRGYKITDSRDSNFNKSATFYWDSANNGPVYTNGTSNISASTYYYNTFSINSGQTCNIASQTVIYCKTFLMQGNLVIGDNSPPYGYLPNAATEASNGYWDNPNYYIHAGGGVGSTTTPAPYSSTGALNPAYSVRQPIDYISYAATGGAVSINTQTLTTQMGGGRGGRGAPNGPDGGAGKGVVKIVAEEFQCTSSATVIAEGGQGGWYGNGNSGAGGGGGGTLWIVCGTLDTRSASSSYGTFTAQMGGGYGHGRGGGGGGYIRIDYARGGYRNDIPINNVSGGGGSAATILKYRSMSFTGVGQFITFF